MAALSVDEYKLSREKKLLLQLENAETLLAPLHDAKRKIEQEAEAHTDRVAWAGFAASGVQTGLFARLTWWEYSWDIVEPVTYFATYSTVAATFGYYLYTQQSFEYPSARERVYTKQFYRRAQKQNFDIEKYNRLVTEVDELRNQLKRLRDPLEHHHHHH
uniref:Mitochondrial Calcium Uniporter n=1 Tax=Caenorhabditis elegans TaxID=6239 RepID=UPI0007B78B5B|nr:Chain A, Mitochondrial Calcium Uniporter [Caenorhabditis elegans]5ID3_B Chain B, Mitochondrial Calcium Uniporter [Caenorhabditis elegans]5ID3_C Chain C, Mitochondrial Calcium Uniporter [Caenorhabditis elegans]5ID3_D Chain D, Mitochondrial Calcium Uniporter [Caenorhabditis elegans]5ID3_E Chain E, Mitochondrial Calcium Uniporter [Caenorhabditis elegans]